MLAVRLDPSLEEKLEQHCRREGLTKAAVVRRALEREIAGAVRHPLEIIEQLTHGLKDSDSPLSSQNASQRINRKLLAEQHR